MTGGVVCFLLREEIFPLLEAVHHSFPDASVREDGEEKGAQRFGELIKEALHWEARRKQDIAYDLGLLLRDEKRYEEAASAFSEFLNENPDQGIADVVYKERSKMYAALGLLDKAAEDSRKYAAVFEKKYGHAPPLT